MTDSYPNLNLTITVNKDEGYDLEAKSTNGVLTDKLRPQNRQELNVILADVTAVLNSIASSGQYSEKIIIDKDLCDEDLKKIAELNLFNRIFPETGGCIKLIKKALEKPSKIQINAGNNFFIPWSLFYEKDLKYKEKIDRESFWGFKHVIEQVPVIENMWENGIDLASADLQLSFNRDNNIDNKYSVNFIEDQVKFFEYVKGLFHFKVENRMYKKQIMSDFGKTEQVLDSIIYFFCHAQESLTRADTYMQLTAPDSQVTLQDLYNYCDGKNLQKEPLVFMNACESAHMSPLFYDGFVRYFVNKGSRAVIGTIATVPMIFSSAFALLFFEKLFRGENVGDIMLELKKEFRDNYNNIIGLYYVAYCFADFHMTAIPDELRSEIEQLRNVIKKEWLRMQSSKKA
jgi:hypothetical protein